MNELPREYAYLSGAELLAARALPERDVTLPGLGTVRVRALTRGEVLELRTHLADFAELELRIIAAGLVRPVITLDEARQLQAGAGARDLDPIVDAIRELSGLDEDAAAQQAMAQFRPAS